MTGIQANSSPEPRLSWIMIFFNGERFMDQAIASVVGQIGVEDWELILTDDGSTDGSTAIARRWEATDPERIRYVEHDGHANRGMSAARNLGLSHARGELVGFLDCDDILLPTTMQRVADTFDRHADAEAVIGRTLMWFGWSDFDRPHRDRLMPHPHGVAVDVPLAPTELFHAYYGGEPRQWTVPGTCSLAARRTALERIGGFDESFTGMFEDQVLYAKLGLRLSTVLDDDLYALYRQHGNSAVAVDGRSEHWFPWRRNPPQDRFLEWLEGYVDETCGSGSSEAAIVRANQQWRQAFGPGLHQMWWSARLGLMDRLPGRAADLLRRLRAGPRGNARRPVDPLSPTVRATVTSWTNDLDRMVDPLRCRD